MAAGAARSSWALLAVVVLCARASARIENDTIICDRHEARRVRARAGTLTLTVHLVGAGAVEGMPLPKLHATMTREGRTVTINAKITGNLWWSDCGVALSREFTVEAVTPGEVYEIRVPVGARLETDGVLIDQLSEAEAELTAKEEWKKRGAVRKLMDADSRNQTGVFERLLDHVDPVVRKDAASWLSRKESALPLLLARAADPQVGRAAAVAASRHGGREAESLLASLLTRGSPPARAAAAQQLVSRHGKSIEEEIRRTGRYFARRRMLMKRLGPYLPEFRRLLSEEQCVTADLLDALKWIPTPEFAAALAERIDCPDATLRVRIAETLLGYLSPAGVPVLLEDLARTVREAGDECWLPGYVSDLAGLFGDVIQVPHERRVAKGAAAADVLEPMQAWWERNREGFDPMGDYLARLEEGTWYRSQVRWQVLHVAGRRAMRGLALVALEPYPESLRISLDAATILADISPPHGVSALIDLARRKPLYNEGGELFGTLEEIVPDPPASADAVLASRAQRRQDLQPDLDLLREAWLGWWKEHEAAYPDLRTLLTPEHGRRVDDMVRAEGVFVDARAAEKAANREEALRLYSEAFGLNPRRRPVVVALVRCLVRSRPADLPRTLRSWIDHRRAEVALAALEGACKAHAIHTSAVSDETSEVLEGEQEGIADHARRAASLFLTSVHPEVREAAAKECLDEDDLLETLGDADPAVRAAAAQALLSHRDFTKTRTTEALCGLMAEDVWSVRVAVLGWLYCRRGQAEAFVPGVLACLRHENGTVRQSAIHALAYVSGPGLVAPLIEMLDDPRMDRRRVIDVLGRVTGQEFRERDMTVLLKKWKEWWETKGRARYGAPLPEGAAERP